MNILNLQQTIYFCDKYRITYNELVLLEILLLAQEGEQTEIINDYFQSKMRGSTLDLLTNLQNAGVILKTWKLPKKGDTLDIYAIPINKNLTKDFYRSSFEMGQELWDAYPEFGYINNSPIALKAVAKKFDSVEDSFAYYGRQIHNKPEKHQEILELVKWANEHNILNCTFATFLVDRKWDALQKLKDGNELNQTYDTIKLI